MSSLISLCCLAQEEDFPERLTFNFEIKKGSVTLGVNMGDPVVVWEAPRERGKCLCASPRLPFKDQIMAVSQGSSRGGKNFAAVMLPVPSCHHQPACVYPLPKGGVGWGLWRPWLCAWAWLAGEPSVICCQAKCGHPWVILHWFGFTAMTGT